MAGESRSGSKPKPSSDAVPKCFDRTCVAVASENAHAGRRVEEQFRICRMTGFKITSEFFLDQALGRFDSGQLIAEFAAGSCAAKKRPVESSTQANPTCLPASSGSGPA